MTQTCETRSFCYLYWPDVEPALGTAAGHHQTIRTKGQGRDGSNVATQCHVCFLPGMSSLLLVVADMDFRCTQLRTVETWIHFTREVRSIVLNTRIKTQCQETKATKHVWILEKYQIWYSKVSEERNYSILEISPCTECLSVYMCISSTLHEIGEDIIQWQLICSTFL